MFEQLTRRLQGTLRRLRGSVKIDPASYDEAARELRVALLEADVHFTVVKRFLARVREQALGQEVTRSLTPGQQVVKIVHDELVRLLGGQNAPLRLVGRAPHVLVVVGLQGSGKTTSVAKLGHWLRRQGRSPLVTSVDVVRPAAREQLAVLAEAAGLWFERGDGDEPIAIARQAVAAARRRGDDVVLIDTAGRLHVDEAMMQELRRLQEAIAPEIVLYVADALVGQDAVAAASSFAEVLPVDGHILTKLDGDARGGAALSIVAVTGRPIYFAGVGEGVEALEPFHPDRMASRILGMGDVLTLVERVQEKVALEDAEGLEKRARRGDLTLEDFRRQLRQVRRLGPMSQLLELLPGAASVPGLATMAPDERELTKIQAIIDSMTPGERRRPRIIDASRRRRIAAGSGTEVQDVNRLLKRFARTRKLMKKLGKKGRSGEWAKTPGF